MDRIILEKLYDLALEELEGEFVRNDIQVPSYSTKCNETQPIEDAVEVFPDDAKTIDEVDSYTVTFCPSWAVVKISMKRNCNE